jgi:hypothetical protein
MSQTASNRVPITREDERRLLQLAPGVIQRRSNAYLFELGLGLLQWILISAVGLMGLYWWNWNPLAIVTVFLIGAYAGLIADLLASIFQRARVLRELDRFQEDQFVWSVVMARMMGKHDRERTASGRTVLGIMNFIDVLFGGLSFAVFWFGAQHLGIDWMGLLREQTSVRWAAITVLCLPLLNLILQALPRRQGDETAAHLSNPGGRGILLFFLMFLFGPLIDTPSHMHTIALVLHWATLGFAALGLFGWWLMIRERSWLRRFVAENRR